jgi:predicted PurR-regulated permease PerM
VSTPEARSHAAGPGRRSASLLIVATVAAGVALYLAQEVFIPIALGLLFTALLRPIVQVLLSRFQIPAPVTATLVVVGCLALFGTSVFLLAKPVKTWVSEAPATLAAARGKLERIRRPIKQVSQAVEQVQKEVTGEKKSVQAPATASASSPVIPPIVGRVFATTAGILGALLQTIVIVFLLLATGDLFTRKLAVVMPRPVSGTAEDAVADAEAVMRRYLVVTLLLSAGQGVVVALTFWLIGMPSPVLWGVLTLVFECLPYLGALFMVAAVTITAFATFEGIGQILLVPLAYITISTIQNNVVSPFAYGGGLRLNALAVLLVVLVGWFLWGVAGAFVAVPLLAAVKVFADRSGRDSRLATILDE